MVGRANVGKSSLYNCFLLSNGVSNEPTSRQQLAIVGPEPGTTRDRREAVCSCGSLNLLMTDTAGVQTNLDSEGDPLLLQINAQVGVVCR